MPIKRQILLTNDDGIKSPGLWAAAEALSALGYVTVAAPREQSSGTGRSLPLSSDGVISPETVTVHGKDWTVYAVGGTPAQAVLHGILDIVVDGYQARDHTLKRANGRNITYPDGRKLFLGSSGTGAPTDGADPTEKKPAK